MKKSSIFAVFAFIAATLTAQAFQVTYNNTTYDIVTQNMAYNDPGAPALLASQPWYGSYAAASTFATTVWNQLGLQLPGSQLNPQWGPLFVYDGAPSAAVYIDYAGNVYPINFSNSTQYTFTYALVNSQTSSSVPDGGTTAVLLGLGMLGLAKLRRRFMRA